MGEESQDGPRAGIGLSRNGARRGGHAPGAGGRSLSPLVDPRNDTDAWGASGRLPPGGGAGRFLRGNQRMRAEQHDRAMDDQRLGALLRAIRIRRRLRQEDVAARAGVDRSWVSRIERGHVRDVSTGRLRAIAGVLEVGIEIVPSWRGGEVARVVNERHSRLHELFAAHLARTPGWEFATEVSFSSWGERGVIDLLAWHAARRVLLVIELKTEIPDPAGLIAQVDRYRRLAPEIGRERGWNATSVATWVLLAESDMNRRQLARHRVMLRNAFPLDGRTLRRWLRDPGGAGVAGAGAGVGGGAGAVNGLAFLANAGPAITNPRLGPTKRVRARPILANATPGKQRRGNPGLQGRSVAVRASREGSYPG
jgi:transcriptional regulator with XRE-family HTH domain